MSNQRPRILDLFCGGGGAAMGYARAGFQVVGVDNVPQLRYPFDFVLADALTYPTDGFDAIHASPPCQAYSDLRHHWEAQGREYPDLIAATRERLREAGVPYVIENVPGAPLISPVVVCGGALGLGTNGRHLLRHRLFESNVALLVPPCHHWGFQAVGVYGHGSWDNTGNDRRGGYQASTPEGREAMDTPWLRQRDLSQAIPPAYTELIGAQLRDHLRAYA